MDGPLDPSARTSGLVLAGAAALGAYQVGVLSHVVEKVTRELAVPIGFDVMSGTSAGAINVAAMASSADNLAAGAARLRQAWTSLRVDQTLRPSAIALLSMLTDLVGAPARVRRAFLAHGVRGGLLDGRPIERLCNEAVDPARIEAHLRAGRIRGIALAATRIATGRAVVFHQTTAPPRNLGSSTMVAVRLNATHALASAAVPLLFPAVAIDGELYCDGGLRQMVPLSPALHLGARRLLVVTSVAPVRSADDAAAQARRSAVSSPLFLAGKALNALFTDGIEGDLDRLEQVNRLLEAGTRRFGTSFAAELDAELGQLGGVPIRPVAILHIAPSLDLGALAAAYVVGPGFAARTRGVAARVLRWLADGDSARAGDLLSYLLFDGGFAAELIALGRADAWARHDELVAFFGG